MDALSLRPWISTRARDKFMTVPAVAMLWPSAIRRTTESLNVMSHVLEKHRQAGRLFQKRLLQSHCFHIWQCREPLPSLAKYKRSGGGLFGASCLRQKPVTEKAPRTLKGKKSLTALGCKMQPRFWGPFSSRRVLSRAHLVCAPGGQKFEVRSCLPRALPCDTHLHVRLARVHDSYGPDGHQCVLSA